VGSGVGGGGGQAEDQAHEGEAAGGSAPTALRAIDVARAARLGQASADGDPPEMFVKLGALHVIVISNLNSVAAAHVSWFRV
jgi:hypothetical protein